MPRPMHIPVFSTGANLRRPDKATPQDARRAARMNQSLYVAEYHLRQGYITGGEWRWFMFFWTWCSARFSGQPGIRQERAYDRLGSDLFFRRRERVKALRARLAKEDVCAKQ
jgi:hypothetical protein